MTLSKGSLVSAAGAFMTLILFFLSPWVNISIGPIGLGTPTGLSVAGQAPILYGVAIVAVIALFVILLSGIGTLPNQAASLLLLVLAVAPILFLLFALPNLVPKLGPLPPLGQVEWGFWGTLVALALVGVGGLMNLLGVD